VHVYACECMYRHRHGVQEVASSNLAAPIAGTVVMTGYLWVRGLTGFGSAATLGCYFSPAAANLRQRDTASLSWFARGWGHDVCVEQYAFFRQVGLVGQLMAR